ncbi:MAG: hypothetical protein SV377_01355 [Halobacteria archaeon]|nr:hypothetical protein [Halobacteria archaeon]
MLPEGNKLYDNLNSNFIQLDELVQELEDHQLDGYMKFEGGDTEGFVYFETGLPQKAKITENGQERVEESMSEVISVLSDGSYTLQVVECDDSELDIIRRQFESEQMYEDLSSSYIDLRSFLRDLTEQELDCYIVMKDETKTGIIMMDGGIPSATAFNLRDRDIRGKEALEELLSYAEANDMTIDVFKVTKDEEGGIQEQVEEGPDLESELEGIASDFEGKADDILDEMGLGNVKNDS